MRRVFSYTSAISSPISKNLGEVLPTIENRFLLLEVIRIAN